MSSKDVAQEWIDFKSIPNTKRCWRNKKLLARVFTFWVQPCFNSFSFFEGTALKVVISLNLEYVKK